MIYRIHGYHVPLAANSRQGETVRSTVKKLAAQNLKGVARTGEKILGLAPQYAI